MASWEGERWGSGEADFESASAREKADVWRLALKGPNEEVSTPPPLKTSYQVEAVWFS